MAKDGYAWWKERFANMSRYFDAYRIDHILGFFRIWTIPREQTQGLMGYFEPALPFTSEEIRQRGIPFDYDRMARPYITDDILEKVFSDRTSVIREKYLDRRKDAPCMISKKLSTHKGRSPFIFLP